MITFSSSYVCGSLTACSSKRIDVVLNDLANFGMVKVLGTRVLKLHEEHLPW